MYRSRWPTKRKGKYDFCFRNYHTRKGMSFINLVCQNPWHIFHAMACNGKLNWMSDKMFLKCVYRGIFNRKLDLKNPQTFNEKIQWLKLYDHNPNYSIMVDKYDAKQYVASIIGSEHIIPTLGIWDRFDDIDFHELPDRFVLKCTHDSGGLVICKDKSKFDIDKARGKIVECLSNNFFYYGREWPYKNVKPRIIAEKYMEDDSGELKDYKFFCFNGVARCFKVDFDRFVSHRANYYDEKNNLIKFGEVSCPPDFNKIINLPSTIEKMKKLANTLAEGIPFLRTDFYDVKGEIYFGELTFYPASGFGLFTSDEFDRLLGSWIKLP